MRMGRTQTKPKIHCLAQRQQLRINVLLATLNSSAPIWLSCSCSYHISKQSFSGYFSVPISLSSRLKCYSDESETSQFLMNCMKCDRCFLLRGWAKWEQSVCPEWHRETFGLVMTSARRACLFYSQRWCEKDETESGWQEMKEREHSHVDMNACSVLYALYHCEANRERLAGELMHVKHVVMCKTWMCFWCPPLHALLVLYHYWNNTAT